MQFKMPSKAFRPFYSHSVAFHGERKGERTIAFTTDCMVIEDSPLTMSEGTAPTRERTFVVSLPCLGWKDITPPHFGEWINFLWGDKWVWAKANAVTHMPNGEIIVTAIWSPDNDGGPTWLE